METEPVGAAAHMAPSTPAQRSPFDLALLVLLGLAYLAPLWVPGHLAHPPAAGDFDGTPGAERLTASPASCDAGDRNGDHTYSLRAPGQRGSVLVRLHVTCSGFDFWKPGAGSLFHPFAAAADVDGDGRLDIVLHNPRLTRSRAVSLDHSLIAAGDWYVPHHGSGFTLKRLPAHWAIRYVYKEQVGAALVILAFLLTLGRRRVRPPLPDERSPSLLLPGIWVLLYAGAWSGAMARSFAFRAFPWLLLASGMVEAARIFFRSHATRRTGRSHTEDLLAISTIFLLAWAMAWFPEAPDGTEREQSANVCSHVLTFTAIRGGWSDRQHLPPTGDPRRDLDWLEGKATLDTTRLLWDWRAHYVGLRWEGGIPDEPRPVLFDRAGNHPGLGRNVAFSNGLVRLLREDEFRALRDRYRDRFPESAWGD